MSDASEPLVRFESVQKSYDGEILVVKDFNLDVAKGEFVTMLGPSGSGKTTLIKLLTRLYTPTHGRIILDGLDIQEWNAEKLRQRVGVIFQDFVRYQMLVGENVGAGDVNYFSDEERWREASDNGMARDFIEQLPQEYHTQLGRWFKGGQELSSGQWQKIALSRAFMRDQADILVLDEPTASMDAQAEATIFEHFSQHAAKKIAILISHRFSTVRMADQIAVMDRGKIIEQGSHQQLLERNGQYAHLFKLQAKGYQ